MSDPTPSSWTITSTSKFTCWGVSSRFAVNGSGALLRMGSRLDGTMIDLMLPVLHDIQLTRYYERTPIRLVFCEGGSDLCLNSRIKHRNHLRPRYVISLYDKWEPSWHFSTKVSTIDQEVSSPLQTSLKCIFILLPDRSNSFGKRLGRWGNSFFW